MPRGISDIESSSVNFYAFGNPLHRVNDIAVMQFIKRPTHILYSAILIGIFLTPIGINKFGLESCKDFSLTSWDIIHTPRYNFCFLIHSDCFMVKTPHGVSSTLSLIS